MSPPLFDEMITLKDGATKDDCERNAARRYFENFGRGHLHLKVIVIENGLSSNGPHIHDLKRLGFRFIDQVPLNQTNQDRTVNFLEN